MKIISFAWTTPALLAGQKTVTRRNWTSGWARQFHWGDLVAAYDRSPRFGGKQVAVIRLMTDPVRESTASAPPSDYAREGFIYLSERGIKVDGRTPDELWNDWLKHPQMLYVVRFELATKGAI